MVFNVGIVGCGVIGQRLSHYFSENPLLSIKTVCDLNKTLADDLANKYSVSSITNYKEMLQDKSIDIIYVGVPPTVHYQIIVDSLQAGKHVISEKPLSLSYKLCQDIIEEKNKHPNLLTTVNLPFRFSSGALKLKEELIDNKKIGDIKNVELVFNYPQWPRSWQDVQWLRTRKEGGPLREVGTHFYFLLNEIFGKLSSVTGEVEFPNDVLCETLSQGIIKINNSISCSFTLDIGKSDRDVNDILFHGEKGSLEFRGWKDLFFVDKKGNKSQYTFEKELGLQDMVTEFTNVLKTRKENSNDGKNKLVTFEDAAEAQLILDAIYNSNGKEIFL